MFDSAKWPKIPNPIPFALQDFTIYDLQETHPHIIVTLISYKYEKNQLNYCLEPPEKNLTK